MEDLVGMDPALAERLETKFTNAAAELQSARTAVQRAVARAWWAGPAADRFRAQWSATLGPRLAQCATSLGAEATSVRAQRLQQVETSNDSIEIGVGGVPFMGGFAGGGGGGGGGWSDQTDAQGRPASPDDLFIPKGGTKAVAGEYRNAQGVVHRYAYTVTTEPQPDGSVRVTTDGVDESGKLLHSVEKQGMFHPQTEAKVEWSSGKDAFAGVKRETQGDFTLLGAPGSYRADAFAGVIAKGEVAAGFDDGRFFATAGGTVGVLAQLSASAGVVVGSGILQTQLDGSASVSVGATASAKGTAHIGVDGVGATAKLDAFAGGQANIGGSAEVAGVKATAGAGVSYGIGGHLDADASVSLHSVKVSVDIGATFGIGGQFKVGIDVDPVKVATKATSFVKGLFK